MPEFKRNSVGPSWVDGRGRKERSAALKHKLMLGLISAMLGAWLQGCTADKPPSREGAALANAAKDVAIPLEAGGKKNPLPETDEVVSQGQEVFLGTCAQCHGTDGRGETDVGRNMGPPAMNLSSQHVQHWSDAELFWIIQNGVRLTGMPSWKSTISENDTWKLVGFVRHLPRLDTASGSTDVRTTSSRHDQDQIVCVSVMMAGELIQRSWRLGESPDILAFRPARACAENWSAGGFSGGSLNWLHWFVHSHRQHNAKLRVTTHHAGICLGGLFQRVGFDHGAYTAHLSKAKRVL
jgi:mono/diheme cytochrome c family protein